MFAAGKPLGIALLGISERDRASLEMFFDQHWSNNCLVVSEEHADLCILDLDSALAPKILQRQRDNHAQRPLIALSVRDTDIKGVQVLRKPLRIKTLKDAIAFYISELDRQTPEMAVPAPEPNLKPVPAPASAPKGTQAQNPAAEETVSIDRRSALPNAATQARIIRGSCGSTGTIKLGNRAESSELYYDPSELFQDRLKSAIDQCRREARPINLHLTGGKYISLLPENNIALTNLSDTKLRTRCLLAIKRSQTSIEIPVQSEFHLLHTRKETPQDIDALLWKVSLWSARGRLPLGTLTDTSIGLRRWPNLTRLLASPQFIRIAALWTKSPSTLSKTAELLNIEGRYVRAFFSACYALELTQTMSNTGDQNMLANNASKPTAQTSLLRRILRRLRVA